MFFVLSKLYQMFLSPVPLMLFAALVGALMTFGRYANFGRWLAVASIGALIALGMTPLGMMLIAPLEDRFPRLPADVPRPYGIIILGGAIHSEESLARDQAIFDEGERMVQGAILAKRFPEAKIVFTGGNGVLFTSGWTTNEAREAKKLLVELGVDSARITIEENSRNTDENARFTAALTHPKPGQRWLLVTSGFHMPRSMGLFEKAGFDVVAYPVAFRTAGPGYAFLWTFDAPQNLRIFEIAAKEWIGLLAYWATGRIDRLFPGPGDGFLPIARGV